SPSPSSYAARPPPPPDLPAPPPQSPPGASADPRSEVPVHRRSGSTHPPAPSAAGSADRLRASVRFGKSAMADSSSPPPLLSAPFGRKGLDAVAQPIVRCA